MDKSWFVKSRFFLKFALFLLLLSLIGCAPAAAPAETPKLEPTTATAATEPAPASNEASGPVKLVMWASTDDTGAI